MSEWWSYSLRDLLLFSPRIYYRLLESYNHDIWPLQFVSVAMGIVFLLLWQNSSKTASRIAIALIALCWLWVAWAYHWQRYAHINWAASYFALAFVAQAFLLFWLGVVRVKFRRYKVPAIRQKVGLTLVIFALFCYPLLGPALGRSWSQAEIFGMAPDPTALAMLGILLLYQARPLWWLYPVPVIWCLLSGATLWAMYSPEYFVTPLIALVVVGVTHYSSSKS